MHSSQNNGELARVDKTFDNKLAKRVYKDKEIKSKEVISCQHQEIMPE